MAVPYIYDSAIWNFLYKAGKSRFHCIYNNKNKHRDVWIEIFR